MNRYKKTPAYAPALLAALLLLGLAGCPNPSGAPEEEACLVSFDAHGGAPAPAPQTVPKGGKAQKPADPALEGRSLLGWRLSEASGPAWDFGLDTVEEDITLHAWWENIELEAESWALLFDSQGGSAVAAVAVKDGEAAPRPADPVRAGHAFEGWHKDAACEIPWDFAVDTVTAHATLYAKWSALILTVRFDPHGGSPAPQDQSVAKGGKAAAPSPVPRKDGFILEGWHTEAAYTSPWDFDLDTVEEDIALHARWTELEPDQAVVAFDADGGSPAPAPQPVALGGKAARPPVDPEKSGFEFDGWFEEAGPAPWDFEADTVEGDMTLHARWTALYAIVIDPRNGGAVEALVVRAGSKLEQPADPSREEHYFAGWHSSVTDTPWNFSGAVTGGMTLYARWIPGWSVSFDSQGGSAVEPLGVKDGETAAKPADPVWAGRTFEGWHKDAACEIPWDFAVDTVTAHATLYAKWSALILTVRFDPQGGSPAPPDQSVAQGGKATQPAVAREGFLLEGWYAEASYTSPWDFAADTVEEDIALHARWTELEPGQAVVAFDADGGSPAPAPQPVALGGKAAKPADPAKPGFEFDGWFEEAGPAPWDFEADTVEGDMTLHARWTALCDIVIDPRNGGSVEALAVRAGSKLEHPADPSRERHRFAGWHSSLADAPWDFNGAVTDSMTLYARWIPLWSVSFDSLGGSPVAPIESVEDGQAIDKPADPIRENNAFGGWHSDPGRTQPWDFEAGTVREDLVLYARWTALVRFDPNGGSPAPRDQVVMSGSLASRPADPILDGSRLTGWHRSLGDGAAWDFAVDRVNGDLTLCAAWELVFVDRIDHVPAEGLANEAISLGSAAVVPANAANRTIVWSVKDPGMTGVAAISNNAFTPAAAGTLILTATIRGGKQDASGNAVDYVEDFPVTISAIRKVTGISNVPANGFTGIAVDLSGATASPANATNKTIVWSVKDPGMTGVAAISGHSFKAPSAGTLVLTARIVNGDETEAGVRDFVQDFAIVVDTAEPLPGGVGLGEDATIKLYANAEAAPLPASETTPVARNSIYYVRILSEHTEIVWRLNGTPSTAKGNTLCLDTGKSGLVKVTVEAKTQDGTLNSGTHSFRIE
jgi:uncharacterized repeat protein (TIGR02543 family)